jgi:hypothetical protein
LIKPHFGGYFVMDKIKMRHIITIFIVLVVLTGCTLPGFSTPTPFSFPTPDKTMTALFEPTQAAPATSASDSSSSSGSDEDQATATPEVIPTSTNTPEFDETEAAEATEAAAPTDTVAPVVSYAGPAVRSGPSVTADYIKKNINIDGDLSGWDPPIQKVIDKVVFGKTNWTGELDCSGTVVAGWDEDYLYLGVRVKDEKYVQEAVQEKIYLGDSIEILFDRYVSADYYLQAMTADDYQIGISPGKGGIAFLVINSKVAAVTTAGLPQAYMWFPKADAGKKTEIKIGALEGGKGYQVEFKIPWSLLGVSNPSSGDHYGFAISISDNDKAGTLKQQTVVSNVATRYFANPTTWGDLYLK